MSTTIDQKVVEMRFNNQQFERNAQTSLNTLEKLKRSLDLRGASKGLESLNSAAKNNNIGVLGQAAEQVGVKFSAMQVIGTTALVNLTNSAMMAGKRIVKALTIDPVKTGFQEYELKMGSIQTIMASTGESLETVNQYLNELNKYSDQTIYSFSDMTNNIGKFTNAGVKLEDAVAAIKGVSNEAAISGANANEASRAMYNFAQALSAGYVKLIDWKSIENANMATVDFKKQLIETAVSLGTVTKGADGMYKTLKGNAFNATKNFNEVLTDQWMTSEVLITTLKKYADTTTDIGKKATQAATEVKTFSMMCDTLKEAAQSGWAETWEIIFGDFNKGKELWTNMANSIGSVIDKMTKVRNTFLKGVFWEPWQLASEYIEDAGLSVEDFKKKLMDTAGVTYKAKTYQEDFNKALKKGKITKDVVIKTLKKYTETSKKSSENTEEMTFKLKKFQKICDEVWKGTYGNGQKRVEALTKAGYKYNEVQELVNKTQRGRKLTLDDLSESQLKSIGYTDEEIKKIKELSKEAETSGTSFNKLIENLSRPSGRELVLETVNNLLKEFSKLSEAAKKAFDKVFGGTDASGGLYKFLEYLRDLSEQFDISEKDAENFGKIMEGVFAAIQIGWNITGAGLKAGIKLLSAVLNLFGTDLGSVLTYVADLIVRFNDWAKENTIWWGYINNTAKIIHALVEGIYDCIKAVIGLNKVGETFDKVWGWIGKLFGIVDFEAVNNNVEGLVELITKFFDKLEDKIKKIDDLKFDISWNSFKNFIDYAASVLPTFEDLEKGFEKIQSVISRFFNWLGSMKESENLGRDIVLGIAKGIKSTASEAVEAIKNIGITIKEAFCKLLGISSPSKVFIAIGGFIVAGLIYGIQNSTAFLGSSIQEIVSHMFEIAGDVIQNGIPYLVDVVKTLGSKLLEGLKASDIDLGALFVLGSMVTVAFFLKKIYDTLDKLTGGVTSPLKALGGMLNAVTDLLKGIKSNMKAVRIRVYAEAIKSIAMSIAIMAGVFIALSKIDIPNAKQSIGIMLSLVAMLGMLAFAAAKLEPAGFGRFSLFLMAMSASLFIMSIAIKRLASIDPERATIAVYQFAALILGFAGLMTVFGRLSTDSATNIDKAGILIAKIGLSVGIMALVVKLIAGLSGEEITKGLAFIAGVGLIMAAVTKLGDYSGPNADKVGKMIWKMALSMGLLAIVMKLIASMSVGDITKGLIVIGALALLFAGFTKLYSYLVLHKGETVKAGRTMLAMAVSIGILAMAMKLIATMSITDIQKGIGVIFYVSILFAAFVKVSNYAGTNAGKAGRMLLGMAAAIAILAISIKLINSISTSDILRGMIVIAGFEALFAAIIYVSKFAGEHADKAGKMLIKMGVAILIMAAAIALLSLIKPEKIAVATVAIDSMMLCFAALVGVTKFAKTGKKIQKTMFIMVGIIAALAGIIALLSMMNPQGVLSSAIALSTLLITLTGVTAALSKMTMIKLPISALATMALLGLVLAELAVVLWVMKKLDVKPSIESSAALIILLAGLAGVCYIMSGLGPLAIPAAIGIAAFGALVAALALVLAALGKLYQIPGLKEFISDGGNLLQAVGTAMGQFVGGIVGGIGAGVSAALPVIGDNLSTFWNNASGFVSGVSSIDESVASGMKNLAEAILILTGAGLLDLATTWVTGGSSLGSFAKDLKPFGEGLKEFASSVKGIDGESVKGAIDVAKSLVEIADIIPNKGGLAGLLAGDNNIGTFGDDLATFGEGLKKFSDSVHGMGDNEASLDAVVVTAKAIANLAQNLPNVGGLWSKLAGEVDLATFGTQLESLGTSLNTFASNLGTFDKSKVESIKCAANAIKAMSQAGEGINGQSELGKWLFGDNSIATFGAQLPIVGTYIRLFALSLGTFTKEQISTISCGIKAIKAMSKAAEGIDGQAEWAKAIFGDNSIATFARNLPSVGTALNQFATNLGSFREDQRAKVTTAAKAIKTMAEAGAGASENPGWAKKIFGDSGLSAVGSQMATLGTNLKNFAINLGTFGKDKIATVESAVKAIKAFTKLADADLGGAKTNLPGFGDILPAFGDNLSTFCSGMPSTESIDSAVKNLKKIVSMIKEISSAKIASVKEFTDGLSDMGTAGVNAFIKAFTSEYAKTNVKTAAGKLIENAAKGAKSKKSSFKTEVEKVAKSGVSAIENKKIYTSYYDAGAYVVDGFAAGITDNTYKAKNAAAAMAKAAKRAAEKELDENSPSKEFFKIGDFAGLGFVNALDSYAVKAYNASARMASSAKEGFREAIDKVNSILENGVDVQPTISPVLDLSSVSSGIRSMNNMLDMGTTIGVSANVGAINSAMSGRGQNGDNEGIISAINKLRGDLGNIGGDTYIVDGVRYDDGTNVSDAVKTLVRAAKIERRR